MQKWTIELLRNTDPLTFAMNILADRGKKLNKEAPLAKKLDEAKEMLRAIRDICQSNKQYLDGIISAEQAIYLKVQNDYYICDLENHLHNDCNEASGYIRIRGLTPDDVMADKEMVNCIIGWFEKLESSDGNYWDTLDEAVESGISQIISDRHPIPIPCANCGSNSDTIKADGQPILVDGKPCCVRCIKLYGRCCEVCDQETLEGTTRIRGTSRAAGANLIRDACKACSNEGILMDFAVGDEVVATEADSEYQYLAGTITDITIPGTDAHQTDNVTPDIYVDFSGDYPIQLMADVERAFGKLYGEIRPFWELPLNEVIMAPNMLKKIGGA